MKTGVRKIFSEVAETYEFVNHVLTLGLDILWRKKAAREAAQGRGLHWLDVCSGTGEMAQYLSRWAGKKTQIVAVDFCPPMLTKALRRKSPQNLFPVLAEALFLPFAADTFDLVTISFATRNININRSILASHLQEFHRILKPGGRFINLETSQPSSKIIRKLFHSYVRTIVKPIGFLLSGSKRGYHYLSSTIPHFYPPEELSAVIQEAGFSQVSYRLFFFGVAAIHKAFK